MPFSQQGKFFFPTFKEDDCLCPVATLKAYEFLTQNFRHISGENHLFLSFIGQHKPVTSSTIARWLKACLRREGVNTSVFQAHSTRAAAFTKAAMSGVTVEDILKAADWSGQGTFQCFYYKPTHSITFGISVLVAST